MGIAAMPWVAAMRELRQIGGVGNAVVAGMLWGRGNVVVSVRPLRAGASKPAFATKNAWGNVSTASEDGLARAAALAAPLRSPRPLYGSRVFVFGNGRACSRCGARSAPTAPATIARLPGICLWQRTGLLALRRSQRPYGLRVISWCR